MRGIDLDPASSDAAQAVVQARRYYTIEDDGLSQDWAGRVWLNPPYARGVVDLWIDRLCREYESGAVTAACCLVNNATETGWCQRLLSTCRAVWFPTGRIRYWQPDGTDGPPLQGQAMAYLGPEPYRLAEVIASSGVILYR
jgi:hypothetical protein